MHERVIFAGDAAHTVSPFGARGGNGGIQDADNLAWKLAAVLRGSAGPALIESYDAERIPAADENIRASTRSTDFITPKNEARRVFRRAALELAARHAFARRLVNSGRLSLPHVAAESALCTADESGFAAEVGPGSPALDAPLARGAERSWLLQGLGGDFVALHFAASGGPSTSEHERALRAVATDGVGIRLLEVSSPGGIRSAGCDLHDPDGVVASRYGALPGRRICFVRTSTSRRGGGTSTRPQSARRFAARWRGDTEETIVTTKLRTDPNLERPDDFYEALMAMYERHDEEGRHLLDARLILLLANHIGEHATLLDAIRLAAETVPEKGLS